MKITKSRLKNALKNPDKTTSMRVILSNVMRQCGGYTRYVDLINEKDETGEYTARANTLYVDAIDKLIKLEPKLETIDNNINVSFKGMCLPRPETEQIAILTSAKCDSDIVDSDIVDSDKCNDYNELTQDDDSTEGNNP